MGVPSYVQPNLVSGNSKFGHKTIFFYFWRAKFGQKVGFSLMYVKVTFVGKRFEDFRVVHLLEFLDSSKCFMLKYTNICRF